MTRPVRAIRMLSQFGAEALKSSVVKGRYVKRNQNEKISKYISYIAPKVNQRWQNRLRKIAIIDGTYGSFTPMVGGWDPKWDKHNKIAIMRPHKEHKRARTRPERAAKITKAMQDMPDKIIKYRQETADRRPKRGIDRTLKRLEKICTRKYKNKME